MRIISCAGYYGTGSSAVTDFFREFEGVSTLGDYEYRFVWDPDGIADLEYNIVENNNRHNTSEAIKRFIKMTSRLNSFGYAGGYKVFGDDFKRFTDEYVTTITELKAKTWWHRNRIDKGELFCYLDRGYSFLMRIIKGGIHNEKRYSLLQNREDSYFSSIDEETFLKATREYIDKVFSSVNKNNSENFLVDQVVPATNTQRYLRYFNDIKIVVIDRDPRDVFIQDVVRYQAGKIPTKSVEDYVKWFKITRKYSQPQNEDKTRVLRMNFEELIYDYDNAAFKLMDFMGFTEDMHVYKNKYLKIEKSIKNTNLAKRIKGFEKEVKYIEEQLPDYLFDFDSYTR